MAGLLGAGDVEGEEPADAGVANLVHRRVLPKALRQLGRGLGLAPDARLERLEAAEEEGARVGGGDDAGARAELLQAFGILGPLCDDHAEQYVVVAAEVLRRAVEHEVRAVLDRPQVDGRGGGRVDDDAGGMRSGGLEVGHRQERIRRSLEPDEVDIVGRGAGLVELDVTQAPTFELFEQHAGPEVRALCERDRVARGEEGEDERSRSAAARCEQQSVPAVELAELPLRLDTGGVAVALVDELAGLTVLVRPDGGAVDHEVTLAVAFCRRFARPWLLPPMLR